MGILLQKVIVYDKYASYNHLELVSNNAQQTSLRNGLWLDGGVGELERASGVLQIAVCDDEQVVADHLKKMVADIMEKKKENFFVRTFLSGEELLCSEIRYDLIFLDIEMPGIDGIETGKRLQQKYSGSKIVMATGMRERVKEAFVISAFRFVTKPFEIEELTEAIEAFLNGRIGNEEIEVYWNRNLIRVRQRDIIYAEAYDGYIELYIKDQICRKETTLLKLEEELNKKMFFRIHRKYIINLSQIESYQKGTVCMAEGQKLAVSKRNLKEFEKAYVTFDLSYN